MRDSGDQSRANLAAGCHVILEGFFFSFRNSSFGAWFASTHDIMAEMRLFEAGEMRRCRQFLQSKGRNSLITLEV